MNPFYTPRQKKIYEDYKGKSTKFLEEAMKQKKHEDDVLKVIEVILYERNPVSSGT